MNPLVSIIVPVYNAEEYLGYCLNSIISQTYQNLQIILINDGSTDYSPNICNNYQKIDKRISVISIKNNGVSNARNIGLNKATGKYVVFVDSDDVIALDLIEEMVNAAKKTKKQLVVFDILSINFNKPEIDNATSLNSRGFLKKTETTLNKAAFRKNLMQLFYHTSLMESVIGKMYDLTLWKKTGIKFPINISLGEDMIANLNFFKICNGATFISKEKYYHNDIPSSDSLTHKPRKDLLNNQLFLSETLRKNIAMNIENEKECYYNYLTSTILRAMERTLCSPTLDKNQKLSFIESTIDNPVVQESLQNSTYINPKYNQLTKLIQEHNAKKILKLKILQTKFSDHNEPRSIINVTTRKAIRLIGHLSRDKQKFFALDEKIYKDGVKKSLFHH